MKRYLLVVAFLIMLILTFMPRVNAQSSYVLPYPSSMPGSKLYTLRQVYERVMQYWYFGSFGQFTYNLKLSDRYLVEAKTLFEYNQYLLGYRSLEKSNHYYTEIYPQLEIAKNEKKDISKKFEVFQDASKKHIEVLERLKTYLPQEFTWQAERSSPIVLSLWKIIDDSMRLRKEHL